MRAKLFTILIALFSWLALSSCESSTKTFLAPVTFVLSADCDSAGLVKIKDLFQKKGLLVGQNITITVIVESKATAKQNMETVEARAREILIRSSTLITAAEFKALGTRATYTNYAAYAPTDDRKIGQISKFYGY